MSTGDSRRSAPKKSTTPAAAGDTDADVTEGPVGGVLPVKKAIPRAAACPQSAGVRTRESRLRRVVLPGVNRGTISDQR